MLGKRIEMDQFPAELERIERAVGDAVVVGLRSAGEALRGEVVRQMTSAKPYPVADTGEGRRSWTVVDTPDGANVQNPLRYVAIMEEGTKPFLPPFEPLIAWARRKMRGRGRLSKGSAGPRLRAPDREQLAQELAARTRWKIQRYGIRGRYFWRAAMEKLPGFVERSIDHRLARVR